MFTSVMNIIFVASFYYIIITLYWVLQQIFLFPEYCQKYAKPEDAGVAPDEKSSDEELTEDEYASSDEEVAGKADL